MVCHIISILKVTILKYFGNIIIIKILIFKPISYLNWVKTQNSSQLIIFLKLISNSDQMQA